MHIETYSETLELEAESEQPERHLDRDAIAPDLAIVESDFSEMNPTSNVMDDHKNNIDGAALLRDYPILHARVGTASRCFGWPHRHRQAFRQATGD